MAKIKAAQGGYDWVHNTSKAGDYLYLVGWDDTIKVFDVSSPASPTFVRTITTPGNGVIHDVTATGARLYAADIEEGFTYIYDTSAIGVSAAVLLGTVSSGPSSHASWPSSDESILVTTQERPNGKLRIFDISTPASPVLLSEVDRTSLGIDAISPHNPVLFNDDLLFVSWLEAGVVALDISDPSNPQLVGNYDTYPGGAAFYDGNWGVYPFLGLDKVLLSYFEAGLVIVDASSLAPSHTEVPLLRMPEIVILCWRAGVCWHSQAEELSPDPDGLAECIGRRFDAATAWEADSPHRPR